MSLLNSAPPDLDVLDQIADTVEGAVDKVENTGAISKFTRALDKSGASLEEVAAILGTQINNGREPYNQIKAANIILTAHGIIGPQKGAHRDGDINIVIHTKEANVQANNMFSPQREVDE